MPKYRRPTIVPWLSAKVDNREGRFIQAGNSLMLSKQFQTLDPAVRYLYLCMAMESGGRREFLFPQSAAEKYGISPSSFWRHVKVLEEQHMITSQSMKNLRKPNQYAFCLDWKLAPARCRLPMATCSISGPE